MKTTTSSSFCLEEEMNHSSSSSSSSCLARSSLELEEGEIVDEEYLTIDKASIESSQIDLNIPHILDSSSLPETPDGIISIQ